ncbi:DUF6388 family protein [Robbsia andropogonis]|nr:DUF6388 family protein [Robbsia andropogonis]
MTKLTADQLVKGRKRFLDSHPNIKIEIASLTQAHADALGISLEDLRESETMRHLRDVARAKGEDTMELFCSYVADTAEEFNALVEQRRALINRSLGT